MAEIDFVVVGIVRKRLIKQMQGLDTTGKRLQVDLFAPPFVARFKTDKRNDGDVWVLARDPASKMPAVKHAPNVSSGGQTSYTEIGKFLRDGAGGPERQALLKLIGTLLDD